MFKYFIYALLVIQFASNVRASDYDADKTAPLVTASNDIVFEISKHLDRYSAQSYVNTCTRIWKQREIIVNQAMARDYSALGLDMNQVFIALNHPKWTPGDLPRDVLLKMHNWFLTGVYLYEILQPKDFLRPFNLLLSAANLGHMYALESIGCFLRNPEHNEYITMQIEYGNLKPEAKQWGIKRLNQELTKNEKLHEIINDMLVMNNKTFGMADLVEYEQVAGRLLTELSEMQQSEETEALRLVLVEQLERMRTDGNLELFSPTMAKAYLTTLKLPTPFVKYIVLKNDYAVCKYSQEALEIKASNLNSLLNSQFLLDAMDSYSPEMEVLGKCMDFLGFCNHDTKQIYSQEARAAVKKRTDLFRAAMLLGPLDSFALQPRVGDFFDPQAESEQLSLWANENEEKDEAIDVGLLYLGLARNPQAVNLIKPWDALGRLMSANTECMA
jgi:hypothetical protein